MRGKCFVAALLFTALFPAAEASAKPPVTVLAQQKAKQKSKAKAAPSGVINSEVGLTPKTLTFGMDPKAISKVYDKVLDREYLPLYKKSEPGVEMRALDAEVNDKKALIMRNLVEFGSLPTGLDSTPLKGEYTYRNGESVTWIKLRSGRTRYFFFFDKKLWKVYDEHRFNKKGKGLGDSFDSAVTALTEAFKAPPKMVEPDYKTQMFREARWQSRDFNVRLLDRGDINAIVYEDRSVADNLENYRKNEATDEHALSGSVKSALKKNPEAPEAPEPKGKARKRQSE